MKEWFWPVVGVVVVLIVVGTAAYVGYTHGYCDGKGGVMVSGKCLEVKELK